MRPERRRRPKPLELLNLHADAERLFQLLRAEFDVPQVYQLSLRSVEEDPRDISYFAALAMDCSRTLRRLATPGEEITCDAAISVCVQLAGVLELLAPEATEASSDEMLRIKEDLAEAGTVMMDLAPAMDDTVD